MLGVQPSGQGVISGIKSAFYSIKISFFASIYSNVVEFGFANGKVADSYVLYVELVFQGPLKFLYTETNPSKMFIYR
jgi:hypothetical protein